MKPLRFLYLTVLTAVLALSSVVSADDGEKVNKRMTHISKYPVFDQDIVNNAVPETEHAFTGMMEFYVPMQAASGAIPPISGPEGEEADASDYYDVDGVFVERLEVAKPLVNVFVHGPAFEVPNTAFLHSFMDIYASVSLDDGMTWKETNLSQSADLTSFNIVTDPKNGEESEESSLPGNHNILMSVTTPYGTFEAYHASGYDTPYSKECTECHGVGLQGVQQVPSCYSCHRSYQVWSEPAPVEIGPVVFSAKAAQDDSSEDKLTLAGVNVAAGTEVAIINAVTGEPVASKAEDPLTVEAVEPTAEQDNALGRFNIAEEIFEEGSIPCVVAAEYADNTGQILMGPAVAVKDSDGVPIANCAGSPVDLTEYPGGTYNVVHAVEGNKVLVAWPSRFCEQGQPAYSFAWDGDDSDIIENDAEKAAELIAKREAVAELLGVNVEADLYLTDLFGVAGSQGSIDFADEGYPQAGVVPFGCVWTARGVLLAGDDPRTDGEDQVEASHMVWTKAERLTSGRRDPNRIEVHGVKGAGFVITWQEDPDGLRPGQGEGPGEGWSGAVAHSKTDIWYSYIPWEYFDLVENSEDPAGEPVNIVDHILDPEEGGSGRPQVYVPMAVPMRLSNNDKCQAEYYAPGATIPDDKANKAFSYCNYDVAAAYGLQDFCATTAVVPKGQGTDTQDICVNEEGLPNVANTASTRPRTSLQGYDSDGDGAIDSAWVIMAAEESKGLGRFTFTPDGAVCEEVDKDDDAYNPDCIADIGKNQWYFSFDMGDPATSATAAEPNGLVQNLVKQGNMLNQPEVDYRTGEFYPVMNTVDMWNFAASGGKDFEMYNTEIARRSSLLVQGISKVMNSGSGLSAILSWKQGAMRQGGPADVMFRRIVMPADYNNCPEVDAAQPVITSAVLMKDKDNKWKIDIAGTGTDMDKKTDVLIRDAVGQLVIGTIKDEDGEFGTFRGKINKPDPMPCAIQAADAADEPVYGPWFAIEGAEGQCVGEVPVGCTATGGLVSRGIEMNPYSFEYMECEQWLVAPDSNPYYPGGLCGDPATNLSSVVPDTCKDDSTGLSADCPTVTFDGTTYGTSETNPILQGYIQGEGNTIRVLTWHQCPSDGAAMDTSELEGEYFDCDSDSRTDEFVNLKDQSWYNPLDVAKGHRGFLDGDFVMFLYGWSPNWRLNAKGNDRYDLYVRRSFDGGLTWQTTPGAFNASDGNSYSGDGTVTCETYRSTVTQNPQAPEPHVCYDYPAGGNEQARNVTQHQRMRITTLDPRYALSGGKRGTSISEGCVDDTDPTIDTAVMTCDDLSAEYDSDLRNPSRYFMVFEVGDNSTVADGEAEPLDLYYSRAEGFGDDYVVWTETDTGYDDPDAVCYPTVAHEDEKVIGTVIEGSGFCNEFERMNTAGDTHASEASLIGNPDASKLYGVWAQWVLEDDDDYESENLETDAMARRLWWIDDYRSIDPENIWRLPGTQQPDDAEPAQ